MANLRLDTSVLEISLQTEAHPAPDQFPGVLARGILVSALNFAACTCQRHRGLHHRSCQLAALLDGPAPNEVRPYALTRVAWSEDVLSFRLHLYGNACDRVPVIQDALNRLMNHGVGKGRVPVTGVEVHDRLAMGRLEGRAARFSLTPADLKPAPVRTLVKLNTTSPLSLGKTQPGQEVRAPLLAELANMVNRRLAALSMWQAPPTPDLEEHVTHVDLSAVRIRRVSARSRKSMDLYGITGSWTLEANTSLDRIGALASLLTLLPIGGRTSFGFGSIEMRSAENRT